MDRWKRSSLGFEPTNRASQVFGKLFRSNNNNNSDSKAVGAPSLATNWELSNSFIKAEPLSPPKRRKRGGVTSKENRLRPASISGPILYATPFSPSGDKAKNERDAKNNNVKVVKR